MNNHREFLDSSDTEWVGCPLAFYADWEEFHISSNSEDSNFQKFVQNSWKVDGLLRGISWFRMCNILVLEPMEALAVPLAHPRTNLFKFMKQ